MGWDFFVNKSQMLGLCGACRAGLRSIDSNN